MGIFSQLLGITGAILSFYALLAFAVTQASTWFFWSLLIVGIVFLIIFFFTSLSRIWQIVIGLFVALNIPWVAMVITRKAEFWEKLAGQGGFQDKAWFGYGVTTLVFVLNGLFLFLARRLLKEVFQKRSLRYGTSAAVYSVIAVAIIIVGNVASSDFHWQKDFTKEKVNVLTDQSIKAVTNLKEKLTVSAFFDDRNPAKQAAKDLLGQYQIKSKNFSVEFVDPDKEKVLAQKHNAKDGDILVEYGAQSTVTQALTEQGITQAVLKVARTTTPTTCYTIGHGELDPAAPDEDSRGLSAVKGGLENEGFKLKAVDNLSNGVPQDCSMLLVAGPTLQFVAPEANAIDSYLEQGGKAIFLLDPNFPDARLNPKKFMVMDTGLENVLNRWGVDLGKNLLVQARMELFKGPVTDTQVSTANYGSHPIVDPLKGKQTVFFGARSVTKAKGFSGTATDLVSSAGQGASLALSDIDTLFRTKKLTKSANDLPGPVTIGLAIEKTGSDKAEKKTQLVVIGNSEFASNALVRGNEFNFDLILNAANWLSGTEDQISIRPKMIQSSTIDLTPDQTNLIFYIAIIGIPMLVLIFGMDLWWYRRRRG